MWRWLPVLLILLIPFYVITVVAMPGNVSIACGAENDTGRVTDRVGFCTEISFSQTRTYYFDMLRLPVYKLGINLHTANKTFLPLLLGGASVAYYLNNKNREAQR